MTDVVYRTGWWPVLQKRFAGEHGASRWAFEDEQATSFDHPLVSLAIDGALPWERDDGLSWAWHRFEPWDQTDALRIGQATAATREGPHALLQFRRLYVETTEDVLELAPSELATVWENRQRLCGTAEAAAEVYAFLRLLDGRDACYGGYLRYLHDPQVQQAGTQIGTVHEADAFGGSGSAAPEEEDGAGYDGFAMSATYTLGVDSCVDQVADHSFVKPGLLCEAVASWFAQTVPVAALEEPCGEPPCEAVLLYARDIASMSLENLHAAWKARTSAFADLSAAAAALARLRYENGSDLRLNSPDVYLAHALVQELAAFLPESADEPVHGETSPRIPARGMLEDTRHFSSRRLAVREGQATFRQMLVHAYGARCCVTGTEVMELVQAAHIVPYKGQHSNEVANGLLLRVDIHQLFDAHLLSIHPHSLTVEVSERLTDPYYQEMSGRRISVAHLQTSRYLEEHYRAYRLRQWGTMV